LILLLKGGYYVVNKTESKLPFHLIGLNTNIYYKSNYLVKPDEYDPLGQFKWLKDVLTNIQIKGEKAFIFAHISPGKFERYYEQPEEEYSGFHWFRPDFNTKFIDEIILPFSKTIIAQVR
jgi:sphingomyelin phosphodiesterase acid-like 3